MSSRVETNRLSRILVGTDGSPTALDAVAFAIDLAAEQGVVASTALVPGSPAAEIVSCSESHDADLVVVGSHGHGAVVAALHGSVARGVMHTAKRSVLIVRPPHPTPTTHTQKEQH